MSQLRYDRHDKTKPLNAAENLFHTDAYVVIIKKNSAPLKKLIKDLKPLQAMLEELPALIIDDESDLASVNTKDPKKSADRTKINELITEILEIVPRAQYVGYTATPFANVFIDPDDDDATSSRRTSSSPCRGRQSTWASRSSTTSTPTGRATPKTVATSNELAYVRAVKGDPDIDPAVHERELREALDAWVLSGAIKKYREAQTGRVFRHHTMLVHEDVSKAAHFDSAAVVRRLWNTGKFTSGEGLARLRKLFDDDYAEVMAARADGEPVPASFDEVKPYVGQAIAEMTSGGADPVLIVNSDKDVQDQQEALDFDKGRVWRILVGGTKLSRGFTVEGLTVSYFRRKAGQADTLMQAGRWFGFREGYRDLVRLYIRRDDHVDLYEAFEALLLDEEAFRDELGKYAGLDEDGKPIVEPRQIPPLVSQHLPWLKPTARNKMFNAVVKARASVGTFHQLSSIPPRGDETSDRAESRRRRSSRSCSARRTRRPSRITMRRTARPSSSRHAWACRRRRVPGVVRRAALARRTTRPSWDPLRAFIATATDKARIKDWAIIWPQRQTPGRMLKSTSLARRRRSGGGRGASHRASTSPVRTSATSCRRAWSPTGPRSRPRQERHARRPRDLARRGPGRDDREHSGGRGGCRRADLAAGARQIGPEQARAHPVRSRRLGEGRRGRGRRAQGQLISTRPWRRPLSPSSASSRAPRPHL